MTYTDIREGFSIIRLFAMVRLLPGIGTNLHRQRASLDEALPAILRDAFVHSLLGVYGMMSLQIYLRLRKSADWPITSSMSAQYV